MLKKIRQYIDPDFKINKAIDFGCGVGRLVVPLAKLADEVTAVDVSDSMLEETEKNCKARSISNVMLVKSDDSLSSLKGKFNFVHSFIVFQHIPVRRGEMIFKNLLAHLEDGGICVAHFTYASDKKNKKLISRVKSWIPLSANVINLIKGRGFFAPQMQMNEYNLNQLFLSIQKANVLNCCIEFTKHAEDLGVVVYFQKTKAA
jgi:cyclopropane fatty-acyl-phospholipid synthase-like methyltransferase